VPEECGRPLTSDRSCLPLMAPRMQTQRERLSADSTFTPPHADAGSACRVRRLGCPGGGIEEASSGNCLNESRPDHMSET